MAEGEGFLERSVSEFVDLFWKGNVDAGKNVKDAAGGDDAVGKDTGRKDIVGDRGAVVDEEWFPISHILQMCTIL
jgi:hypothetical protein